ncbi:MAG: protein-disulfide reductase DsbD [Gammaproteobacteria bacterium]|nr:protein-disulfide reductase DsbD [Gammaproteobacteria bacterium]
MNHCKRVPVAAYLFGILLLVTGWTAQASSEPLRPEQAFVFDVIAVDADLLRVEWQIAEGYYLYRDKIKLKSNTPGVTLGVATYPKGKFKHDEFFGEMEVYRGKVSIDVPLIHDGSADTLELLGSSQGCADFGFCYPPLKQSKVVALPVIATFSSVPQSTSLSITSSLKSVFSSLGERLGISESEMPFLTPEQAFRYVLEVQDATTLVAHWEIEEGYYLYRDKLSFTLKSDVDGVSLGAPLLPPGKIKNDESFGHSEVYYDAVTIRIPLQRSNLDALDLVLEARYQGCADKGFCYPPTTQESTVSLGSMTQVTTAAAASGSVQKVSTVSETDRIAQSLASDNIVLMALTFFGFGLLLSFTPCVFPMIPILSGIIVGQGESITTRRAFVLSLVYVLAMASTYTVAGVITGLFGANVQAVFKNPWIISAFSGLFVLLALSMFGFYELQLPARWQSKLADMSNSQRGGTLLGVASMGVLSALIVGPCVAAPLAGALIYIGQSGDALLGGVALFAMGLGMGAPLLVIGTSAGKLLPKAGEWLNSIKAVFGVLLLGVAVWMMERVLPAQVSMLLWALLIIISAIYMGALTRLAADASGWHKLRTGLGVVLLVYGILILVGVASGARDIFHPLQNFSAGAGHEGSAAGAVQHVQFKQIKGTAGLRRELATAASNGHFSMLDFYADWCVACKEMERDTFSDASVIQQLADVVLLQTDVTANDEIDQDLMKALGVIGPPSILFFDGNGDEMKAFRIVGYMGPEAFRAHVASVVAVTGRAF